MKFKNSIILLLIVSSFTSALFGQQGKPEKMNNLNQAFIQLDQMYSKIDSLFDNYLDEEAELLLGEYKNVLQQTGSIPHIYKDHPYLNKHKALYIRCKSRLNMPFEKSPAYDSVANELNKAEQYAKLSRDYKTQAAILFSKASLYQVDDKDKAIQAVKTALSLGQKFKDDTIQALSYERLGRLFLYGKSKFIMTEYLMKSMELFQKAGLLGKAAAVAEKNSIFRRFPD